MRPRNVRDVVRGIAPTAGSYIMNELANPHPVGVAVS
jgi:hypothetical protein